MNEQTPTTYAELATERAIDRTLTYHVPPELDGLLRPGHLVRLDLRTAAEPGIVIRVHQDAPHYPDGNPIKTKPILELLDPEPVVTARQLELAQWMSKRYLAALGPCLWLMLPPGIVGQRDVLVELIGDLGSGTSAEQIKIVDALKRRGKLSGIQLGRVVKGRGTAMKAIRQLEREGVVRTESTLAPPRVKPQKINIASLAIQPDHIPHVRRKLGKSNRIADALETIIRLEDDEGAPPHISDILGIPGVGQKTLDALLESGWVDVYDDEFIQPHDDADEALFKLRNGEADLRVLNILARNDKPVEVSWLYAQTDVKREDLRRLAELHLIELDEQQTYRDSLAGREFVPNSAPRLTPGQREVWQVVRDALDSLPTSVGRGGARPQNVETTTTAPTDSHGESEHRTHAGSLPFLSMGKGVGGMGSQNTIFLLHGVTGSGKTEIYLRAIERVLQQGRQAIFLVPEIALTAQTIRRVAARFPGQVAVIHSGLSDGERYDTWSRARRGEIKVVVGARSALFTPLPDVGLIVMDEEHDASFKQSPPVVQPYYHTRDVAERMMRDNQGVLIMGSATPDVETMFRATRGDIHYLHLPDRIMGHRVRIEEQSRETGVTPVYQVEAVRSDAMTIPLPDVDVVDMRAELRNGNTGMFSMALQDALAGILIRGEQAMLFLNRRGKSTFVFCRECGYVAACKHCDMPMIYHAQDDKLHCHHCGRIESNPQKCPSCQSNKIRHFGAGTQEVEAAFSKLFPDTVSLRWDSDSVGKSSDHDFILQRFMRQDAQILIGTQMIAKGLDLPLVTLVGVVSADVGLNLPDFRAAERGFQVLMQVAGRAGRGLLGGKVILQTYQPEHYAIQAASQHDYAGFYEQEIASRRKIGYPPFRRFARILFVDATERKVRHDAISAAQQLQQHIEDNTFTDTHLIGPAPSFYGRINRQFRWQILLRSPDPSAVLRGMDFGTRAYIDIDPTDVL